MKTLIKTKRQTGFSYVEIMITVAVITIALLPIMDSLQTSVKASVYHRENVSSHYHLMAKMEEVLAESYASLEAAIVDSTTESSFSDSATSQNRRAVFLSKYDLDNADSDDNAFTGTDDAIWIKTELVDMGYSFETLVIP